IGNGDRFGPVVGGNVGLTTAMAYGAPGNKDVLVVGAQDASSKNDLYVRPSQTDALQKLVGFDGGFVSKILIDQKDWHIIYVLSTDSDNRPHVRRITLAVDNSGVPTIAAKIDISGNLFQWLKKATAMELVHFVANATTDHSVLL